MNLASIIEPHPPDAVALRHGGRSVSYGRLRYLVEAAHRGLLARGLQVGDRVAVLFPSEPGFAVAYLAALSAGCVAVPLNPQSPDAELESELAAVGAALVVTGAPVAETRRHAIAAEGRDVVTLDELCGPGGEPGSGSAETDEAGDAGGTEGSGQPPVVERDRDDPAALLFTSGTAGFPKAAVLTHGSLLANLEQMELRLGLAPTAEDVGVLVVPPFHILGLNAVLGLTLYCGGSLLMLDRFEPSSFLSDVAAGGVTILAGAPQLFAALAGLDGDGGELAGVRLACSGAAPLPAEVAERFERRFGLPIRQGYGLTEASPTVTFPDLGVPTPPTSVGLPLPGVEVRLVDVDGNEVEPGDPGEILVRGPNVFAGYYGDPEATSAALDRQGWLHTGDIAVMAEDGSLSIVDRSKDLVIVSGFNVFPAEVEAAIERHPAVREAVVVGTPEAAHGEAVRAYVVPTADAWPEASDEPEGLSAEEIVAFCAGSLARYKCPSEVSFVREIPKGLQGKVLRRAVG